MEKLNKLFGDEDAGGGSGGGSGGEGGGDGDGPTEVIYVKAEGQEGAAVGEGAAGVDMLNKLFNMETTGSDGAESSVESEAAGKAEGADEMEEVEATVKAKGDDEGWGEVAPTLADALKAAGDGFAAGDDGGVSSEGGGEGGEGPATTSAKASRADELEVVAPSADVAALNRLFSIGGPGGDDDDLDGGVDLDAVPMRAPPSPSPSPTKEPAVDYKLVRCARVAREKAAARTIVGTEHLSMMARS